MQTVTMEEAKAQLPELIEAAAKNHEPFVIQGGSQKSLLVTVTSASTASGLEAPSRKAGFMKGQFTVPEDFDTMFAGEILEMFGIDK